MHTRVVIILAVLVVIAALGSGCMESGSISNQEDRKSSESVMPASTPYYTVVPTMAAASRSSTGYAGTSEAEGSDLIKQQIIKTGSLSIEVTNVSNAIDVVKWIADRSGGFVGSMQVTRSSGDRLSASFTVRVPAERFDEAATSIGQLGKLKSQSFKAEDVTEEFIDLTARRQGYVNLREQYTKVLEKAETVKDILSVQEAIERNQIEIDRIDGRLKYLTSRVDLGTLSVTLQEPEPVGADEGFSFTPVVNEGIAGFLGVLSAIIVLVIALIPLAVIGIAVYAVYRWRKQKRESKEVHQEQPASPPTPPK
ncbi:MAG: DUF4349 domain-containing protein [Methanomicrobiales archaeon]|jgi:flagellar basal body-associated protein FliL|nr:DUF4349 domain-containing protein [Methanomicrobiales archaeon]